jgi:Lsr2
MLVNMMDDIDGSQADETVRFGLDGEAFELNLSKAHAEELRRSLEPYVKTARKLAANGMAGAFAPLHRTESSQGNPRLGQATRMKVSDSGRVC